MLQPPPSFLPGVAWDDDDDDDDVVGVVDDGAGAAIGPPLPVGARGVPASALLVDCAGTDIAGPPNMGPAPPFSRSWFGGVQIRMHAAAVPASFNGNTISPRKGGPQSHVHVDGQSASTLHEPVATCWHVFHVSSMHVLPGWQMLGIANPGGVQPPSALHDGNGGFGTAEQGIRSAVA